MSSNFKKALSGLMAAVTVASMSQLNAVFAAAAELADSLAVEITDGDVNGDGKTDNADTEALYAFLGESAGAAAMTSRYDVYKDGTVDVRDLLAVRMLADGGSPAKPEIESSGDTVRIEVGSAECVPGEQVSVDVNIIDWDQDIAAAELYLDFDSSLTLVDVTCTGDYQYAAEGSELKLYGITSMADVYRGTVATLTFNVPDTAYGDYDVKVKSCSVYNDSFQTLAPATKVGLIAADVTERPLYLAPAYTNSRSMRLTWSMPYCSGDLEGYIVYRDGEEIARVKDTEYYDEGLETGKKYVYEVQAYGAESYLSAKSKAVTAVPQAPVISALSFTDNASVIGGKSASLRASMEKTVDASAYSLTYVDQQGGTQTIFSGENTALSAADIRWNIKDVPSGEYTLTFSVTDKDGETAEKSVTVTVDTTPPEQVFGFDVFEGEQEMKLTWGIAAEAKVVGYNIYRRTENGAYSLLKYIDGRDTLEYADKSLEEGDIYFYMMCAVDKYGQEGIYSDEKSAAAKGDETAPEVTLFLPESGRVLSRYVTLSVKAEDNVGVSSVAAFISEDGGETWSKLFEGKGSSASYSFDTTKYDEAEVKIKAVAYDYAGNESKDIVHIYAIDNAGPAQVANVRAVSVTDVSAAIAWDDVPDSDFSYFTAKYYPAEDEKDVRTITTSSTLGVNISGLVPDTTYVIEAAAVDIYGNTGAYSEPFEFTTISDTTAPIIASFRPEPGCYSSAVPLVITAQDDYSAASITVQVSRSNAADAEWSDVTVLENSGTGAYYTASYSLDLSDYEDGELYIRAFAEDKAGNTGETSPVYEYIVDKTAPEAPTAFRASSDANAIELSWDVYEDNADSAYFSLYRSTEEEGEYTKILDRSNSLNYFDRSAEPATAYFYKLTAIDAAGNESKMSKPVQAILQEDTEAPEIVSISPAEGSIVSTANNKVSVLASDNVKLASITMEYRLSEDAAYKVFAEIKDINNYYRVAEGTLPKAALTGESVQIRVTAADTAGLEAEAKEITYTVNNSTTDISKIKAEQLSDHISLTWSAAENELSTGYYIYKKANTGSWQRIGSIAAEPENEGSYEFTDSSVNAAGTLVYKVEAYSSNGMMTEKETQPIQIYTNPEASLVVENTQQQNVEYIYDATGCRDYYGIESIAIEYGDGSSDSDSSAATAKFIHKYTETGVYNVVLTCTNEQGLVSVIEQSVEVVERALIGESTVTVKTTEGKAASNINVYVDLGTERQKKLKTDANGKVTFSTAAGIHTIGVFGDGYLPAEKECTILAGSGNRFDFTVTEKDIVTAEFTVERMKLDEIKAAGIDITAPENQHIVEVQLDLTYKVHEAPAGRLTYYVNGSGAVVGGSGGWSGSWGGGSWSGSGTGGSGSVTKPVYISVNPETNEVDTLITMTVPVRASFLKEFFHASLTIYNNADEQYTISQNQVKLNLPDGLSLVDVEASDDEIVNFDVLAGQSVKEIDWIIRGDEEGVYDISASYFGILDRFNEEINAEFAPDEPITVYGASAVSVDVIVPEQLFNNQFVFEVAMTNNSPVDIYCPSTDVGAIISSAFGNSATAYPSVRQRSIKKNGKYERILSHDEPALETLEPGYTYSVIYVAQGVFAGINGKGADAFYSSRLDLINASIKVLGGSRIPVSLSVVPNTDFIVLDELKTLEYDELTEFVLFVTDNKSRNYIGGASITLGEQTATTNADGYAVLSIPESSESLKITYPGYSVKLIQNYSGYRSGMDVVSITSKSDENETKTPSQPVVGNKTDYGTIAIPDSISGDPEDDEYEVTTLPGTLTFGESLTFEFSDDIFLIGGKKLELEGLNFPIEVSVDDEGFTVLKIGEFEKKTDEDDDATLIDDLNAALDVIEEYKGKSMKTVAGEIAAAPAKKNPFKEGDISASVSIMAALSGRYDKAKGYEESIAQDGVCYRGQILLEFEIEYTWGTTIVVASVIPVAIDVTLGAGLSADASFELSYKNKEYDFSGSLVIEGEITGQLFAGLGVSGVVAAGVYGELGLGMKYTLFSLVKEEEGLNEITFTYAVGVKAYLGPFKHEQTFISPDEPIYLYKQQTPTGGTNGAKASSFYAALFDESLYTLQNEKTDSVWSGGGDIISGDGGYLPVQVLLDDALDITQAQLAAVGDKLVLVYLDSDNSRNAVNAYRLMYSVFDAENGWSEPAQADGDATGDYAPYLWSDGEKLYLIYQNTAEGLDDTASVSDWTAAQNIAAAAFDAETLTFGEVKAITSDSSVYDRSPAIAEADGKIYAVWVSNEDTGYFGTNGTNTVMRSELGESGWSAPEKVIDGLSAVTQLTAAEHGGELYTVYITDDDNDLSTSEDRTLHTIKLSESQPYIIASGNVSSAVFAKAAGDEDVCLYWQQDGNIRRSEDFTLSSALLEEETAAVSGEFAIAGNRILWSVADAENSSNLYEAVYDSETGKWGRAVKLTSQEGYIENVRAAEYGGDIITIMNCKSVDISSEAVATANKLAALTVEGIDNLTLEGVYFNKRDYAASTVLPVELTVANKGDKAVSQIHVVVADDSGNIVYDELTAADIPENSVGTLTIDLDFAPEKTSAYTISVNTSEDGDSYPEDNTYTLSTSFSLMTVSAEKTDANTLAVTVANIGSGTGSDEVSVSDYISGNVLDAVSFTDIEAGQSVTKYVDLTRFADTAEENIAVNGTDTRTSETIVLFSAMTDVDPSASGYTLGDVNEDGQINASDASKVLAEYAAMSVGGETTLTDNQKKAADVNGDGKIDANDASAILVYYSKASTGGDPSFN